MIYRNDYVANALYKTTLLLSKSTPALPERLELAYEQLVYYVSCAHPQW